MYLRRLLDWPGRTAAVIAVAGTVLLGCSNTAGISGSQFVSKNSQVAVDRVYRLGVGDKLKVAVFGEENLSGQFEVNAMGQVSMPLIGEIPAKGLSLQQFRDGIIRKLSDGYLNNPKVSAEMLNYRPIYVHGEVKNGGEFQFKNGLKLRDAIAMAGGFTYRADQSFIYISRDGEAEAAVKTPAEVLILPGDNIRIPERFF
jgi:protein involved in polysaccharide export with SLBB domain